MQIDLIIENARVWTGAMERPTASRIGVWRGLIVGLDEELDGVTTHRVLDADGAVIVPGFNDAHAHSVWFGQTMLELNLFGLTTSNDLLERVTAYSFGVAPDEWVIASSYNPLGIEGPFPTRDELDRATEGRPLLIKHASGHAYTLNGIGLHRVGIPDHPTEQPDGGKIVVDGAGRSTGWIEENAMEIVQSVLLPDRQSEIVHALDVATRQYLAEGLTSVTDAGVAGGWIGHSPREFAAYQQALDEGKLHTRMQLLPTIDVLHDVPGHRDEDRTLTLDAGIRTGLGDEWLQVGPVKVFTDGSLLGSTAAMSEEYPNFHGNHGYLLGDPEEMREHILTAAASGWSLALHAVGDRAVEYALAVIGESQSLYGSPSIPHRIEHGGVVHDAQIERLVAEGIVLVSQANFIAEFGDGMTAILGDERSPLSYPIGRTLRAGGIVAGSSDRPVAPGSPLNVMQGMVSRLTESGQLFGPEERITAEEALVAYTAGSAEATGWGHCKGVIRQGYFADLTVLSDNPIDVASDAIGSIEVIATLVGGELRHGELSERSPW